MARWVETLDPASQIESRAMPFDNGIIEEHTSVRIPSTLYRKLRSASVEGQRVFDYLAMRMSNVFPFWKGTRADFRFTDSNPIVVFVLTPMKRFIRVEIRTDTTGYKNRRGLFPAAPAASSLYPGTWVRANISDHATATAIADDIANLLENLNMR